MTEIVRIDAGRVVADSRDVAEAFGKEHRNVLRAIDALIVDAGERLLNFEQSFYEAETGRGTVRQFRRFDMDRDGFALLAMGFTGAKALQWKLRYIDAFNRMEAALTEARQAVVAAQPVIAFTQAQVETIDAVQKIASACRWANLYGGKPAARRLWAMLGGPDVFGGDAGAVARLERAANADVVLWSDTRVETAPGARVPTSSLYADFRRWCGRHGRPVLNLKGFAESLSLLGIQKKMSNGSWRLDVRLRPAGECV